ncbi:hypothetical protein QTP88_011672 [Uroleucon formosanum]
MKSEVEGHLFFDAYKRQRIESSREVLEQYAEEGAVFLNSIVTRDKIKIMATVFWARKGVLLVEFMPTGTTINLASYYKILEKLRQAIKNRRMLTKGVRLLHDNTHVASNTKALLDKFGWDILPNPLHPRPNTIRLSLVHQLKETYGREKAEFGRRSENCSEGELAKRGGRKVL